MPDYTTIVNIVNEIFRLDDFVGEWVDDKKV